MRMTFKRLALLGDHPARMTAALVELTSSRLDFLGLLVIHGRCQRELAELLCVSEPVVSRMVRALVRLGLVERHIPIADRRFRIVSLTRKGRDVFDVLMDCELPLCMDDSDDVRGLAESSWVQDWYVTLQRAGLGFLARMHDEALSETSSPRAPFAAMRLHHRRGAYRDFWGADSQMDADSPEATRAPRAPRLQDGVVADTSLTAA